MSTPYQEGYNTGLTWNESYTPGGPWTMRPHSSDSSEMRKRCEQTLMDNKKWHLGFQQGLQEQRNGTQNEP